MSPQLVQLFRESESWSHVVMGLRISVNFISVSPDDDTKRKFYDKPQICLLTVLLTYERRALCVSVVEVKPQRAFDVLL